MMFKFVNCNALENYSKIFREWFDLRLQVIKLVTTLFVNEMEMLYNMAYDEYNIIDYTEHIGMGWHCYTQYLRFNNSKYSALDLA